MNKQDKTSGPAADPVDAAGTAAGTAIAVSPETSPAISPETSPETSPADDADDGLVSGAQEDRKTGRRKGGKGRRKNSKSGHKGGRKIAPRALTPTVVELQPVARPARMKRRHWGLLASFFILVLGPLAGIIFYLWTYAGDQYVSTTGFTVRSQESGGATELLGGLAQFASSSTASDSDILYKFILSQEMVEAVDAKVDLRAHYSAFWPDDWAFAIWPDATLEDLVWYWGRIVGVAYDSGTGMIEVQAVAYDAETARAITSEIVRESQARINALNNQARGDAMRYANDDLQEALAQVKAAREALIKFRTRTRIVDPAADIQVRLGVMTNLQQQLAEALIEYDLLRSTTTSTTDPRLTKAQQRIDVIRERILIERQTFASNSTETGAVGEDYPTLISEFESLTVDLEYAETTYRAALTAREVARDDVARQSRYLATYIKPTLSQTSGYPERYVLSGLSGLFLLLVWSILALVYYSIRDRS